MDKNHINPTEKREVFCAGSLAVREGDDKKIIEGVAIVTEKETVLWEGSDYREIEVIAQSCINREFIAQQNMTLNLLHNRDESFARTPKSCALSPEKTASILRQTSPTATSASEHAHSQRMAHIKAALSSSTQKTTRLQNVRQLTERKSMSSDTPLLRESQP